MMWFTNGQAGKEKLVRAYAHPSTAGRIRSNALEFEFGAAAGPIMIR